MGDYGEAATVIVAAFFVEEGMEPIKERLKLGEILIQQKILTPLMVNRVIQISGATHRRFGQTLEDMGLLTGEELAAALAVQFGYKILGDIASLPITAETLGFVTAEEAVENQIFPLQAKEGRLALAMADPTNYDLINSLAGRLKLRIVPFISNTREIMKAISKHYLGIALEQMKNSILVVETDSREREALVATLAAEGYHAIEAVDPEDGFRQALLQQPSLIITAKDMPFSDGFAFFTTLRGVQETRRIPVILLSLRPTAEEEAMAFKRGFFDYIPLPVRDITLFSRVNRAISAGRSYNPHRRESAVFEL